MKTQTKFRLITVSVLLLFINTSNLLAQVWLDKIPAEKREDPSFNDNKQAFYDYYNSSGEKKDYRALKRYKRWEWIMEQKIDANGKVPSTAIYNEWYKINQKRKNEKSLTGNWTSLGPNYTPFWKPPFSYKSGSGRIDCIEFHPTDNNIIWAGAHSGGFWKTTNGGATWYTTTDNLMSIGVSDIVVNPSNPNILYMGTGDRDSETTNSIGILKSIDGGETWNTTGMINTLDQAKKVNEIIINPINTNVLFAATRGGIYKTSNAGDSWQLIKAGNFMSILYKPSDTTTIYATTFNANGGASIFKSINGGETFTSVTTSSISYSQVVRIALAVTPADPNVVYAVCTKKSSNYELQGIYKSIDNGTTWTQKIAGTTINLLGRAVDGSDLQSQGWYVLTIAASPTDANQIYVGSINIWKSNDGGSNWNILTHESPGVATNVSYMWVDHHDLKFNPQTNVLFTGNDGGICKTDDFGQNWTDISDGLSITQFYRIGLSASDENIIVGGCQDQFGFMYNNGLWEGLMTGEAGEHFVDPIDPNIIYSGGYGVGIAKSTDGGNNYFSINPVGSSEYVWLPPFIMSPHNRNTLYFGTNKIYKSTDAGNSWTSISSTVSSNLVKIEVSKTDSNTIYAITSNEVFKTIDGGTNWISINSNLPASYINDIEISSTNANIVWVTLANYTNTKKVFRTNDGGTTWINVSYNIPNIWMNCLVQQEGTNNGIYLGTEMGVYYIDDSMNNWVDFNNGLPNVIVTEMEIQYNSGKLIAGTYGRGLWKSDLYTGTGIFNNYSNTDRLEIYPNPNNGVFDLKIESSIDQNITVKVINSLGQLVYNNSFKSNNNIVSSKIDIKNCTQGIYNVIIETNKGITSKKVIIIK